jgi:hypothetical protein
MSVARMQLPELTDIHDNFLALSRFARERFGDTLGGKLLLRSPFDVDGIATVIGASIAGAASLCLDADGDRLRGALRSGFVDFVVATLDEAVRILKNEIRRARSVSVGVATNPETCLNSMIERGLQPNLLSGLQHEAMILQDRGGIVITGQPGPDAETSLLEWSVVDNAARAMQHLAGLAAESLDSHRDDTGARHRWLAQSPRYLGRSFASRQCLRMTAGEIADFLSHARSELPAAQITRDGEGI